MQCPVPSLANKLNLNSLNGKEITLLASTYHVIEVLAARAARANPSSFISVLGIVSIPYQGRRLAGMLFLVSRVVCK